VKLCFIFEFLANREKSESYFVLLVAADSLLDFRLRHRNPIVVFELADANGTLLQPIQFIEDTLKRYITHEVEGILLLLRLLVLLEDEGLRTAERIVDQSYFI